MTEEQVLAIFQTCGALMEGHFLLSSGLHSPRYLQSALVLQYPDYTEQLCHALAGPFRELEPETVIAPAIGGIVVAYEMARQLGIRCLFAERDEQGAMVLRRGFQLGVAEPVLVVEDVCTTGGSIQEVMQAVRAAGASVLGVGALVDRSGATAAFDVPFRTLVRLEEPAYRPQECPQCAQGVPVVKPGSRRR